MEHVDDYTMPTRTKAGALNALIAIEKPLDGSTSNLALLAKEMGFVYIKGCTREVAFGLGAMPEVSEHYKKYTGKDAYAQLLKYKTGLLSRSPGESQIVGQFAEAFRKREQENPSSLLDYSKLSQWLNDDNRTVRHAVTADLQSAYFETMAQRIDKRPAGEPVVVVIDEDARGNLSETTKNLLRQLGSFSHNVPNTILFTHYDANVLARHTHEIQSLSTRGTIHTTVEPVNFDTFLSAPLDSELFRKSRYIYVCPACSRYPEAEARLVAWQDEAAAFGTKMVVLGGEKKQRRTEGAWIGEHFNITMPEQITEAQKEKKTENQHLIEAGKRACDNCAYSRDIGKRPLQRSLSLSIEDYTHLHGSSSGRGRDTPGS